MYLLKLLVDNSQSDLQFHTINALTHNRSWLTVIRSSSNLGYFGGLNYGLSNSHYCISLYDFVVVSNADIMISNDFLQNLVSISSTISKSNPVICPQIFSESNLPENLM